LHLLLLLLHLLLLLLQVEPYFNETGSNCPSILPRQQQKELLELSVNSVKVTGCFNY
jgi:hypothetical protein